MDCSGAGPQPRCAQMGRPPPPGGSEFCRFYLWFYERLQTSFLHRELFEVSKVVSSSRCLQDLENAWIILALKNKNGMNHKYWDFSRFLDGGWGSDPEDGEFAARLRTPSGAVRSSSWHQGCAHPETRRYRASPVSPTSTLTVSPCPSPQFVSVIQDRQKGCYDLIIFYSGLRTQSFPTAFWIQCCLQTGFQSTSYSISD